MATGDHKVATWTAIVAYSCERGGSWMDGNGATKQAAIEAAIARHQHILGSAPPKGSEVLIYRGAKHVGSETL